MKTARFTDVVNRCGRPSVYVSWLPPEKDPVLKKAVNENRVLTVHQELHGGKKDYATVGFLKDRHAQLLIFPKSLRRFTDRHLVAINYDLLTEGPAQSGKAPAVPTRRKAAPAATSPASAAATPSPRASRAKAPPRPPASPEKSGASPGSIPPLLVAELRRVRDELAAGKAVPAFQRLERLLTALPS